VNAVATGAVGGYERSAFGGEAVVAVHVAGDAIAGKAELAGEADAFVATGAGRCRGRGSARLRASWDRHGT
jgi:hypothetical protein